MLWVGSHLVVASLAEVGVGVFHHILETAEHTWCPQQAASLTLARQRPSCPASSVSFSAPSSMVVVGASALARRVRAKALFFPSFTRPGRRMRDRVPGLVGVIG